MASVAQEESRKISERTRWGQLQAMKNGVVFGNNSLYGYMVRNGRLTVQPEQAEVVRLVYNEFLVERKGTSRDQFEAVQEELAKRAGMAGDKSKFSARYWFSGKIRCGVCGRAFTVKRTARAGSREYQRFVCRGHYDATIRCRMRSIRGEVILACAQRVLQELALDNERIVSELLQELRELRRVQIGNAVDDRKIQAAIQRQLDRKDRALEAFLDGDLTRADMQRLTSRCEDELLRLREQLAEAEKQRAKLERGEDRFEEIRVLLEQELNGGENVLDEVIQRITVYEDHFIIESAELPVSFRVRAEGSGAGKGFEVTVAECTPVVDSMVT